MTLADPAALVATREGQLFLNDLLQHFLPEPQRAPALGSPVDQTVNCRRRSVATGPPVDLVLGSRHPLALVPATACHDISWRS